MDRLLSTHDDRLGDVRIPDAPLGVIIVTGDEAASDEAVARALYEAEFATVQLGDSSGPNAARSRRTASAITERLLAAADWLGTQPELSALRVGIFGTHAGGGAALAAAGRRPETFRAIVARDGRAPVEGTVLKGVRAATLLIADAHDDVSLAFNREAMTRVQGIAELEILPGAPGALDDSDILQVARLARRWFARFLS